MYACVLLQVWKERPAWDLQTAGKVCAVPATFGPRSASQCWKRARCARSTSGKALTLWRSSSGVTVAKVWAAGCRKEITARPHAASTHARDSEMLSSRIIYWMCLGSGTRLKEHRRTSPVEMDMKWDTLFCFVLFLIYCSYFVPSPVCVSTSQSRYKCFSMELGIWWLQYITVL